MALPYPLFANMEGDFPNGMTDLALVHEGHRYRPLGTSQCSKTYIQRSKTYMMWALFRVNLAPGTSRKFQVTYTGIGPTQCYLISLRNHLERKPEP